MLNGSPGESRFSEAQKSASGAFWEGDELSLNSPTSSKWENGQKQEPGVWIYNGQTKHKNRILIHSLQHSVQEAKQCLWQSTQEARAWLMTALLIFSWDQLRPSWESQICTSTQSQAMLCFQLACLQFPQANNSSFRCTFFSTLYKLFPHLCPLLRLCQTQMMAANSLAIETS